MLLRMIYENIQRQKLINNQIKKIIDVDDKTKSLIEQLKIQLNIELKNQNELMYLIRNKI